MLTCSYASACAPLLSAHQQWRGGCIDTHRLTWVGVDCLYQLQGCLPQLLVVDCQQFFTVLFSQHIPESLDVWHLCQGLGLQAAVNLQNFVRNGGMTPDLTCA